MRRFLFGPVSPAYASEHLLPFRETGACLAFGPAAALDVPISPTDTWATVAARFPGGWQPDFVVVDLAYKDVPAAIWSAPVPLVGLAGDWNLLWHHYRHCLPRCEWVLTDPPGVERLRRAGVAHAAGANLYGCAPSLLAEAEVAVNRDIDILFVGNLHPAVQRERLPWLARLARLGDLWNVVIRTGTYGAPYRQLLRRARIVFNRSIRGECNLRAFEAAAAGALLFQEAGNREVPRYFQDRQECACYADDNLEALLQHYLNHEDERQAIAAAARAKVGQFTFEHCWTEALAAIERAWPAISARRGQRPAPDHQGQLLARTWQALCSQQPTDGSLRAELTDAVSASEAAPLHYALGLLSATTPGVEANKIALAAAAAFRRAVELAPAHALARLNLAEALALAGQNAEAATQAQQALPWLDGDRELHPDTWEAAHFPPGYDEFRVAWEQAAWEWAGDQAGERQAKRALLRWRLHGLLGKLTGDIEWHTRAVAARPDLASGQAALGAAHLWQHQPDPALAALQTALAANPLDRAATRRLYAALGQLGRVSEQLQVARQQRLLAQVIPQMVPAERWFTEAPPADDECVSIAVLCRNQLEYTRLCIQSVFRHTRPPYELILVNNGSTDGTATYLNALRPPPGLVRLRVLHNDANRGFPAGCNQALDHARSRFLLFLNNDTVVTADYLPGLLSALRHRWPEVGLVGPVSNATVAGQQIVTDYADLGDLAEFAAARRAQFGAKVQPVERLAGLCLLVRRDVFDRVGRWDERYGLGFFDDFDLCLRAREAGYQLVIAPGVFVHHFGERTFHDLGIKPSEQYLANFQQFLKKWGPERTARFVPEMQAHLPAALAVAAVAPPPQRPRVALCMIVKNEEANLPRCLQTVADLVDEIVVVDTGSTDRTKALAQQAGARVHDFVWVDSFAAARNESLRHASCEWIFWLDADDWLDEANRTKLRQLFAGLRDENVAYMMRQASLPDQLTGTTLIVEHAKLFRNRPEIRWEYRVHEQILPAVLRSGGAVRRTEITFQHGGYLDAALRQRKAERNWRLLELQQRESPDDPFIHFNLASIQLERGRAAAAEQAFRKSLERSPPNYSLTRKTYALLVHTCQVQGKRAEALAACQEGLVRFPDDPELLFHAGLLQREQGDLAGAAASLLRVLQGQPAPSFACHDTGLHGYKTRHNLALVYRDQRRYADAAAEWRQAVAEQPDYVPSWLALADLHLLQNQPAELAALLGELDGTLAAVVRAHVHIKRQEYPAARALLEAAVAQTPQAYWPQALLAHTVFKIGRDPATAERLLRAVLQLDPHNVPAQRQLQQLLRQQSTLVPSLGE